jgi:hypothetical protein
VAETQPTASPPPKEAREERPKKKRKPAEPAAAAGTETSAAVAPAPRAGDRTKPAAKGRKRRRKADLFEDYDEGESEEVEEEAGSEFPEEEADPLLGAEVVTRVRKKKKPRRKVKTRTELLRRRKKLRRRDEMVKPSPPLQKTDPLGAYLSGQMVPCPVGCGGFSEVVRVGTLPNGSGEVWFECLSCAQRRQFIIPKAKPAENAEIARLEEEAREVYCPRHTVPVALRRRGRQFVCPACGVVFSP